MYLNKAVIIGNLTKDPELKALPNGMKVCSFSVATNRIWKDANGTKQEAADFHNVVVFGKQAEATAQYMKKGSQIMVEGRMQTRSWEDRNSGEKKYRTEVIAENVQFGSRVTNTDSQETHYEEPSVQVENNTVQASTMTSVAPNGEQIDTSEIPF